MLGVRSAVGLLLIEVKSIRSKGPLNERMWHSWRRKNNYFRLSVRQVMDSNTFNQGWPKFYGTTSKRARIQFYISTVFGSEVNQIWLLWGQKGKKGSVIYFLLTVKWEFIEICHQRKQQFNEALSSLKTFTSRCMYVRDWTIPLYTIIAIASVCYWNYYTKQKRNYVDTFHQVIIAFSYTWSKQHLPLGVFWLTAYR